MDDSTYSVASSDPDELSAKLTNQYRRLADYLGDTGLVINDDKTHLVVMGTRKDKEKRKDVKIETGTVTVSPKATEKLLGLHIHETLKFAEHIRDNENSLFKRIHPKISALKRLSTRASFKTRLMVANSTIMSQLTYMITVWGGTENYLIEGAQVIQNNAARIVTKLGWYTSQQTLLRQTNWLSVKQMIFYHTVLHVWRVQKFEKPVYIHNKLDTHYNYNTRRATSGNIRLPEIRTNLGQKGFMFRGAAMWNTLPDNLKCTDIPQQGYKKLLKSGYKRIYLCKIPPLMKV